MRITVLGGTGYAGGHLVTEAASRSHHVTSLSRSLPAERVDGVHYETGSVAQPDVRERVVSGADVVISALSPRGALADGFVDVLLGVAAEADRAGVRLGVIGGFTSLRPAPGAQRFIETSDIPAEFAPEVRTMVDSLVALTERAPASLDWFFVSPGAEFGSPWPGERTGRYRLGGDVALVDADGASKIGGADFALGVIDIAEDPTRSGHLSLAY